MATTIRTQTAPAPQPQQGIFRRIANAIGEAISPTPPPVRERSGPDRYSTKTTPDISKPRGLANLTNGSQHRVAALRNPTGLPMTDQELFGVLDEMKRIG